MEVFNQSRALTLAELNTEEMAKNVGGIIFVSILMITGLIGNIHVLIVFGRKMKPSNHRTFICFLGVIDLTSCSIGMPFVIVDLTHPFTFYMTSVCKILRTANYFIGASSVFLMLVVSVDRYRKVCQPLGWQLSNKTAKVACVVVIAIAIGLSWPALLLFGHSTVDTGHRNITGVRCSTDDEYIHTSYQTMFNIALCFMVMCAFVVHVVLYSIICRVIRNHGLNNLKIKKIKSLKHSPDLRNSFSSSEIAIVSFLNPSPQSIKSRDKRVTDKQNGTDSRCSSCSSSVKYLNDSPSGGVHVKNQVKMFRETRRMTIIFFVVIAVFFMSYIPHLVLKIVVYSQEEFLGNLSKAGLILYNTFIWCFFVNNVANPVVYLFLDIKFRATVTSFYKRVFFC